MSADRAYWNVSLKRQLCELVDKAISEIPGYRSRAMFVEEATRRFLEKKGYNASPTKK